MSVGATATEQFRVTAEDQERFRVLSGDDNPLHHDDAFARSRGFAGRVVYGGLLLAMVSRLLGNQLPGAGCVWHGLKMSFRAPLYLDEPAVLRATVTQVSEGLALSRIALEIAAGERRIASGEATAILAEPKP